MKKCMFLLSLLLASSFCEAQSAKAKRTILFVGAHPDDETAISEVLRRYSREGNRFILLILPFPLRC